MKTSDHARLGSILDAVEKRVRNGHGTEDLIQLCKEDACERDELLWLLLECCGPVVVLNSERLFGWGLDQLNKNLDLIRSCANVTASLRRSIFGTLLQPVPGNVLQFLPDNLKTLAELAETAKWDFRKAEWFRRVAKIRITDHITYKSHDHKPHDKQISGLIAAVTHKDYNADAHRRFRNHYKDLLSNRELDPDGRSSIDPYTVRNDSQRQETISVLQEGMRNHPEMKQAVKSYLLSFRQLSRKLASCAPNRKARKKGH